ncbi:MULTISPECIES: DUF3634 family protein [Vibrio]|uniref:DUF3634 family protein n=1 Tax=Vibrio TaxID=662 RepID=UPI0001B956A0|nr:MULTISPECIES: DUF3634 family protein [Vibrio]EEX31040.1 hypothetical protein VIC_003985 [Vibrio coralliilyticus ATCC BAA-450]KFI09874.1 hypothetical protein IX95_21925 [Vibrio sp. B183]MCC2524141.1 DUF3634 family protein [Vibrio coralliilyticus]MCM5507339.1 DUF3634 family protein [Vibrio sp. SCSIO 43169]MDE3896242.1 DUF3634 family protein [Vibrio sp. CC007]
MLYVILVAAIVVFWLVAVDRPVLRVQFKSGHITKEKGHFPPTFRHNILDIAERDPFDGELKVYQQRTGSKLVFSKQVPKKVQQRIRNVFPHQGFRSKGKKKAH